MNNPPGKTLSLNACSRFYDFESHFHCVGDQRLHYLDEGAGPPIVLVHGNPSWSFMYRDLVSELRSHFRVIAPDHIGCGLSSKPQSKEYEFTLAQRIDDLEALLEQLQLTEPVNLVVHDWGGLIGLGYAVRHPERIARVVVLNTAAFRIPQGKSLHWTIRWCRKSRVAAYLILRHNVFSRIATLVGCRQSPMTKEIRRAYCCPYNSPENRTAILKFVQDIPLAPTDRSYQLVVEIEEKLADLKNCPVLICWGERDFVFDLDFLDEWFKFFPAAQVRRFPEAGHYVLEDAKESVVPIVKEFLGS